MSFRKKLIGIILLIVPSFHLNAQEVEVTITGMKTDKGQLVFGIFRDDVTFQKEEAAITKVFPKNDLVNHTMTVSFNMEPGVWGLTLLDDENNSGLMEYNFIGIPKEGFGFSDFYASGLTKPKFDSFKFTLEKDQKKKISIRLRYI